MTIHSENVRKLCDEFNLINDPTEYGIISATYALIHDYGDIVIGDSGLIVISFDAHTNSPNYGYFRVRVGATLYSYAFKQSQVAARFSFIVYALAGTYNIRVEAAGGAGITEYIDDFQAGVVEPNDLEGAVLAAYSGAISKVTTVRITPLGSIKNTVYCVTAYAETAGAQTSMENPGEALTNGVQVLFDGVQKSWSERWQGDANGMAAGGKMYVAASAGASHSVTITKDNAGTVVNINVAVCPWILPPAIFEPVELDFSQGSTLYLVMEPLNANVTTNVYVGKVRCVSFGAATDYYASASVAGINVFSYTFDVVKVGFYGVFMFVSGFGGMITHLAVDLR